MPVAAVVLCVLGSVTCQAENRLQSPTISASRMFAAYCERSSIAIAFLIVLKELTHINSCPSQRSLIDGMRSLTLENLSIVSRLEST